MTGRHTARRWETSNPLSVHAEECVCLIQPLWRSRIYQTRNAAFIHSSRTPCQLKTRRPAAVTPRNTADWSAASRGRPGLSKVADDRFSLH